MVDVSDIKSLTKAYCDGFMHPIRNIEMSDEVNNGYATEEEAIASIAGRYSRFATYTSFMIAALVGFNWSSKYDSGRVAILDKKTGRWLANNFVLKPGGISFKKK